MNEKTKNALHTPESKAKAIAARKANAAKKVAISPKRQAKINKRYNEMPKLYRKTYLKAVHCKSMRAALTAFCLECVADQRIEIQLCTDLGCPLWGYRPYQDSIEEEIEGISDDD